MKADAVLAREGAFWPDTCLVIGQQRHKGVLCHPWSRGQDPRPQPTGYPLELSVSSALGSSLPSLCPNLQQNT